MTKIRTGQAPAALSREQFHERWVAAHAVIILAPTYWYQSPSPLKLLIDRMVCADGGNPDPTTTDGKSVIKAKRIEQMGWNFPKHVAGPGRSQECGAFGGQCRQGTVSRPVKSTGCPTQASPAKVTP